MEVNHTELTPEQLRAIDADVTLKMGGQWLTIPDGSIRIIVPSSDRRIGFWPSATGNEPLAADWDYYLPRYTEDYAAWAEVERWMVENFKGAKQARYARSITNTAKTLHPSVYNIGVIGFVVATAPLPLRCLAFLRAMGVDVEELVGTNEHK
jgi:hypothetical protein